jgi:Protein of unknown function (DUF2799)
MRSLQFALILLGAALLTGCATMNKEECFSADWQENGYNDGASGADRDTLKSRREACAEHGIVPDKEAYLEGYEHGLEDFCTMDNGYDKGRRGYHYKGVCPSGLEGKFLMGYQEGRAIYELESRIEEYQNAIAERSQQLNNIAYQKYRDENILASKEATDQERQQALARIRYRQRQVYVLRNELFNLQQYQEDLSHQLMQMNPRSWRR